MVDGRNDRSGEPDNRIAIVGMAAHLPGSSTLSEYWANLRDGLECIRHLSESELLANGEDRSRMLHRNYVPAAAELDGFADFDAEFFGLSAKEEKEVWNTEQTLIKYPTAASVRSVAHLTEGGKS